MESAENNHEGVAKSSEEAAQPATSTPIWGPLNTHNWYA